MSLGDFQTFVGIDVSQGRLDVHLRPGGACAGFAHDGRGIGRLVAWIASHDRPLVVVEATGGLEHELVRLLDRTGVAGAVVNPRQPAISPRPAGFWPRPMRWMAPVGIIVPKATAPVAQSQGGHPMQISTVGIDLAKRVFQIHGVDQDGNVVLRKQLRRAQVLGFFAKLPPCLVGMEACGTSHHWAREIEPSAMRCA